MADLSYHPEARHEIREAAAFYQRRRQGLGEEFLAELERIIGKILPIAFAIAILGIEGARDARSSG